MNAHDFSMITDDESGKRALVTNNYQAGPPPILVVHSLFGEHDLILRTAPVEQNSICE